MKPYLLFEEELKIVDKFVEWCEKNSATNVAGNMVVYLHDNDALNINKCRELIAEPIPAIETNELTLDAVRETLKENTEQKKILQNIVDGIEQHMKFWGTSGRLIDRESVYTFMESMKDDAETVLKRSS